MFGYNSCTLAEVCLPIILDVNLKNSKDRDYALALTNKFSDYPRQWSSLFTPFIGTSKIITYRIREEAPQDWKQLMFLHGALNNVPTLVSAYLPYVEPNTTMSDRWPYAFPNALLVACRYGHEEVVEVLLDDPRIDIGVLHYGAVHAAVTNGFPRITVLLFNAMAPWQYNEFMTDGVPQHIANVFAYGLMDQVFDDAEVPESYRVRYQFE
jgi:hypothetical protein